MTKHYQWTISLVILGLDFGRAASQLKGIKRETAHNNYESSLFGRFRFDFGQELKNVIGMMQTR